MEEEDFLNQERYLNTYISSKIKINKWGRLKVRHALIHKGFDQEIINSKLTNISENEYKHIIRDLILGKEKSLNDSDIAIRKNKTYQYLLRKGFESDIILEILHDVFDS